MNLPTYLPPAEAKGEPVEVLEATGAGIGPGGCMILGPKGQKLLLTRRQAKALVTKLTVHLATTGESTGD